MLKTHAAILSGEMDKISSDILSLEQELKKGCFSAFLYDIPEHEFKLYWAAMSRRLTVVSYDESLNLPLIESKLEIRKKAYPYLDKFISNLIEHSIGIQNPKLELTKG